MRENPDRQKIVEEKIRKAETGAQTRLAIIREVVKDLLTHDKGYTDDDVEVDAGFDIVVDGQRTPLSVDYILRLQGRRFMLIKCCPGAMESRERHLVAFARVVDAYQIPYATVTDGVHARMLDAVKGSVVAEGLDAIPARQQAIDLMNSVEFRPYPAERMEREKRILLAFESIKCTEESCE